MASRCHASGRDRHDRRRRLLRRRAGGGTGAWTGIAAGHAAGGRRGEPCLHRSRREPELPYARGNRRGARPIWERERMSRPKILIDCDPGHDDAVAILYAARHLDLVGVTTVHGNNTLENTTRNGLAVLELAGLDVPLAKGSAEPLAQARVAAAPVHGKSGLDGTELPVPKRQPVDA